MSKKKSKASKVRVLDEAALPELPPGWAWANVQQLAAPNEQPVLTGPFGSSLGRADFIESGVPVLTIGCLTQSGVKLDKAVYVSEEKAQELDRYRVREGDLLFSRSASVGRAGYVTKALENSLINYHLMRLRLDDSVMNPLTFIYYVRGSGTVKAYLREVNHGATRDGINTTDLLGMPVSVPPPEEQKRIVSKIEELFSDLDAGVAALKRARANLRRYRASVLKSAVEGRLTAAWRSANPGVEPASELLARILRERRQRWEQQQLATYESKGKKPPNNWQSKYKEPASPDTANLPELPNGWCWATVDQLTYYLRNGLSKKPSQTPPGHRILRINAVRPMSLDQNEVRYYQHDGIDDYFIESGELLFTRYNGSLELLGVCALVPELDHPTLHPDKLIRLKTVLRGPLPAYMAIAANVGASRKHMTGRARTTAGQTGISGGDVKEMPIPLCSSDEQTQIAALATEQLDAIARTDEMLEANKSRSARLRQSILKRAFDGQLLKTNGQNQTSFNFQYADA